MFFNLLKSKAGKVGKVGKVSKVFIGMIVSILCYGCAKELQPQWLGPEAQVMGNGIEYIYLKHGSGEVVKGGMRVSAMVILKIGDSTEVWNTRKTQELFVFVFRKDNMIDGFEDIIGISKPGDRIKAIIPPYLGYGSEGSGDQIPRNAYLSFDIEIFFAEKN